MIQKHDPTSRIFGLVFAIVFALLSLVIAYAAFTNKGSFDLRSKAMVYTPPLKTWTFDADDEGWKAMDFGKSSVTGGKYSLEVSSDSTLVPRLENDSIDFAFLYPKNKIEVLLSIPKSAVTPTPTLAPMPKCVRMPQQCARGKQPCPTLQIGSSYCTSQNDYGQRQGGFFGNFEGKSPDRQREQEAPTVSLVLSYRLKGSTTYEKLKPVRVRLDGKVNRVRAEILEDVSLKQLEGIRISFAQLRDAAKATIDIEEITILKKDDNCTTVRTGVPGGSGTTTVTCK